MKHRRQAVARTARPAPPVPRPRLPETASPPQLVQIEKPVYGGAFLARGELNGDDRGQALFIPLALPGEQARVRVVEQKRGYAKAEVEEIVTPAPERATAPCPYFGPCGGCQYQHATYEAQLEFKQATLRETLERGGVRPPAVIDMLAGNPWEYRNRIRLAFDAAGNPGYRGRRSHQVISIAECPIATPVLVRAALAAAEFFRGMPAESRPAELALFCDAEESSMLATVFTAAAAGAPLRDNFGALLDKIPYLRGVELVEQQTIRRPRIVAQSGATSIRYRAAGFAYRVDHGAFFQVNRWLVDALVERVTAGRAGKLAWDLFAGVGLFARQLAARFERVVAVESAPPAHAALTENLREAGAKAVERSASGARAIAASTLSFLERAHRKERPDYERPDWIVVDPPRTGLGPEATALLARIAAPVLTYVSCDPATLARDLRALLAAGYAIERLTLADLFPQTFHLESVVDLRLE